MRKLGFVLMALVLMAFAVPALAVEKGEMTFGLTGGMAMPMGDFGDVAKAGFGGGVFGDYWLTPAIALGVDGAYNRFGLDEDLVSALEAFSGESVDGNFTFMQFGAHAKYLFPMKDAPVAPWVSAGAGMYNMKAKLEVGSESGDDTESKIGLNGAVGLDFKATPAVKVGVVGTFHHIMTDDEATQYFTVGLTLGFSTAAQTK
jgi:hypothetical protein